MKASTETPGLRTFLLTVAGLLKQWRVVVVIPFVCMVVTLVLVLVVHPTFRAMTSFIVDSETAPLRGTTGLASLASQFGFPISSGGQSPAFFADLATTREVLLAVAGARYHTSAARGDSVVLLPQLYHFAPIDTPKGMDAILKRLRRDIQAGTNVETGIVSVTVDAPDAVLAAAIADTLLQAVNRFNLERRQLRSRALRRFLESRLETARSELNATEETLRVFRERNRAIMQSPELTLRDQRLQRDVDLRQQVYVTLATSYEQARVEEFRDTPSLTVVDPPRAPYKKVRPQRSLLVAGAGLLGLILGLGIALLRQSVTALNQEELTAWAAARSAAEEIPIVRALKRRQSPGG